MVPNAMAVGVQPTSEDLSFPRPISLPPRAPVGLAPSLVVNWLSGKAVGKLLVLLDSVVMLAEKDVAGFWRSGPRGGAVGSDVGNEDEVGESVSVGLAGLRTGAGCWGSLGESVFFGEWVLETLGEKDVFEGEGDSSSDEISPGSSRISMRRSSLRKRGRRTIRLVG